MHVLIIGNGVTGITAAITIRKLSPDHRVTVVSAESEHFFSRTALMYLYMGHMTYQHIKPYEAWFWQENKINLMQGRVEHINFETKQVQLTDQQGLTYDKLLLATGSVPNNLNIPGEGLKGVQGFYSLQDLEELEANSAGVNRAVIIGGGLIGIELAEMFYTRCIPVTFLVREQHYWGTILPPEEATIIENHIRAHGIDLHLNTRATEIIGDANGKVMGIATDKKETISCQLVGAAIGVKPNIHFLTDSDLETNRGILVNQFLETNLPDVYAAGDCAEFRNPLTESPAVEQLWYTGRMQGETVAHTICGKPTPYHRGIWFNSAKFFDIEYQTYGRVPALLPPDQKTIYWQHPQGKKCIRINYTSETLAVVGFNLLGIRYRHEVCERWIKEQRPITYVLQHLREANFDPEFYRRHEKEALAVFNKQMSG